MSTAPAVASPVIPVTADSRVTGWVRSHFSYVWRSLRRLGLSPADADDAAQQVFVVAARRSGDIATGSERGFLYGTALRVAQKARRTRARHPEDLGEFDAVDSAPVPDELVDLRRARVLLDRVLATLDDDARAVFVLYEIEELTMAEIAVTLGVPPGTVASRLRRARDTFTRQVERLARPTGGLR